MILLRPKSLSSTVKYNKVEYDIWFNFIFLKLNRFITFFIYVVCKVSVVGRLDINDIRYIETLLNVILSNSKMFEDMKNVYASRSDRIYELFTIKFFKEKTFTLFKSINCVLLR